MQKLTKRVVGSATFREKRYALWDPELRGFGVVVHPLAGAGEVAPRSTSCGTSRGWAIGGTRGLEEIEQGRDRLSSVGWEIGMPDLHASIAEVNRDLGRIEDARTALEAAFAFSEKNENRRWDAQRHRLEGELRLASGAVEKAESCFRQALEVARRQEAKGYEIGAATCMAGMLRDRGRRDEARALLEPVYRWFIEDFDTADLKNAKALLEGPP